MKEYGFGKVEIKENDFGKVEITTSSDIAKEIRKVGKGIIKDFIINEGYSNGHFVIKSCEDGKAISISCSNIWNMVLLLENYFGGVVKSGRILDEKRYIGEEIFFGIDGKGRINYFTPTALVPKEVIEAYKNYQKKKEE